MSELHAALVAALAEMPNVRKTGTGNYGRFAELDEILDRVRPVLHKHGLAVLQDVSGLPDNRLGVTTLIVHTSGETLATGPLPMPAPNDPQKVGSSITYGRRYALMATLNLAAEDDDGQAAKPAPEPTYSAQAVQLFTACRNLPDDRKAALKEFAAENGRKVSTAAFDSDTAWADQVRAFIQLGATKESK